MGFKTKTKIANRKNYGSKRNTNVIKFLVYHYTANDGDRDEGNANYFHNNVVKASAHRFVDDDSVTISVPDNYVAWHCGGGLQGSKGHKFHKICTNTNSIGIEMCDTVKNGKHDISKKTRENAILLGRELVKKYGIKKDHVIRHFDVTGKNCPAYYVKDEKAWEEFKNEIFKTESKPKQDTKKGYSGTFPALGKKGYLSQGDKGINVERLQKFLNWCINAKLSTDGSFGSATKKAVKKYQKKYGLSADGNFGPASLKKAKSIKK